ncbi:MAG: helix-hairpin-helix domain-containing protein [Bacteroidia bacterium]
MPVREGITFTSSHKKGLYVLFIAILILTIGIVSMRYISEEEKLSMEFSDPFFTSPVYAPDTLSRLDINLADSAQWTSLKGIGPVLARRILNYRRSIGGFYAVEQLAQVYGLSPETYLSVAPYLFVNDITAPARKENLMSETRRGGADIPLLDINLATAQELKKLPGIGEVLSERIVRYRASLNGFESVEDLGAVYGLKPEVLQKIQDHLYVNTLTLSELRKQHPAQPEITDLLAQGPDTETKGTELRSLRDLPFEKLGAAGVSRGQDAEGSASASISPVDINLADSAQLIAVPGIGAVLSGKILRYRMKLGFYYDLSQLRDIYGLSEENFARMQPYLFIGNTSHYPRKDLNMVYARSLAGYPSIDMELAEAIARERKKNGRFDSWEEVEKISKMTPEAMLVLKAYFKI